MSTPAYIYKIVLFLPDPLPERLPVSELDKVSGCLHFSTGRQIPETLTFFFDDIPKVYVLRVKYEGVAKDTKWENQTGGRYFGHQHLTQLFTFV